MADAGERLVPGIDLWMAGVEPEYDKEDWNAHIVGLLDRLLQPRTVALVVV